MSIRGTFHLRRKNKTSAYDDEGIEYDDDDDELENKGDKDEVRKLKKVKINHDSDLDDPSEDYPDVVIKNPSAKKEEKGKEKEEDDNQLGERRGNIISISINGNKKIPKPTGILGDYYNNNDPYGPDWMESVVYQRLEQYHANRYVHFLGLVASHLGKSSASLRDNSDGAALVNEIGMINVITNQFNKNKGEEISNSRMSRPAKDDSSSSSSSTNSKPVNTGDKTIGEVGQDLGPKNVKKLPARFNQKELYVWLLQDRERLTATDLAIADKLFSKGMNEDIKWLEFPSIGGKLPISETMSGSMDYCLWEINKQMRRNLTEVKLIHDHPEAYSLLVAKKIELASRTRFLTDIGRKELKTEYALALEQVIEEISKKSPSFVAYSSSQVMQRIQMNKNKFGNPSLIDSNFMASNTGRVSSFDKWAFGF